MHPDRPASCLRTSDMAQHSPIAGSSHPWILHAFPPEITQMVMDEIDPVDWLALKLSCKAFAAFLPEKLQDVVRRYNDNRALPGPQDLKRQVIQTFARYEHAHAGSIDTKNLTCTHCGHLRARTLFPDSHVKSLKPRVAYTMPARVPYHNFVRICISCGANKSEYKYTKYLPTCWWETLLRLLPLRESETSARERIVKDKGGQENSSRLFFPGRGKTV